MPPIRSESSQKSAYQEGRVLLAFDDIKNGHINSIRATARLYDIPHTTLANRTKNVFVHVDYCPTDYKLIELEKKSFVEQILFMDLCGATPRSVSVGEIANILLVTCGETPLTTIGKNWPSTFIKCRDDFWLCLSKQYHYQHTLNKNLKVLQAWLITIQNVIDKNNIQTKNISNFDKTNFAIDFILLQKIVIKSNYHSWRILLQPGNRK